MVRIALSAFLVASALAGAPVAVAQDESARDAALPAPSESFELEAEGRRYRIDLYRVSVGEGPTTVPRLYVLQGEAYGAELAFRLHGDVPRWRSQGVIIAINRLGLETPEELADARREEFSDEAAATRRFLRDSLRPEIDRRLGENAWRDTLAGEGDAALFVLHMAAEAPEAFDAYIAHGPHLNQDLPTEITEGRGWVYMSSVRWMGEPLDQFEGFAVRLLDHGREVQVDTSVTGWEHTDAVNALWMWAGPYFIPPPV